MLDGTTFYVHGSAVEHLHSVLLFRGVAAEYDGFYFKDKGNNAIRVSGSLHKFKNSGLHNADDFTFRDFKYVLWKMEHGLLKLNPDILVFNKLEFGVNIVLPWSVEKFFKSIILYRGHGIKPVKIISYRICDERRLKFNKFYIKTYIKSLQSPEYAVPNMLRFEIVIKNTDQIRKRLIDDNETICRTLRDLDNLDVWQDLSRELLRCFDALVIFDVDLDVQELHRSGRINEKEANLLRDGQDFEYWNKLTSSTRQRRFEKFIKLLDEHSISSVMKKTVRNIICEKIAFLCDPKNCTYSVGDGSYSADFQKVEVCAFPTSDEAGICPTFQSQSTIAELTEEEVINTSSNNNIKMLNIKNTIK